MILLDLSQIAISNLMMSPNLKKGDVDDALIKHMVLNSIRAYNTKFKSTFGEIVICCDSRKYWRKDIFPYYKAHRSESRKKSKFDWKEVFNVIREFKDELRTYFPYKVIEVEGAEGDDVIAVLAKHAEEKTLIISSDKDYIQLLKNPHVHQYSPKAKDFVKVDDPKFTLFDLIVNGDSGDGIPNIKSDSDTFVVKEKRQKPIRKTDIKQWYNTSPKTFCTTVQMLDNFKRNEKLIDFDHIPVNITTSILEEYAEPVTGNKTSILEYFSKNRMKHLVSYLNDF